MGVDIGRWRAAIGLFYNRPYRTSKTPIYLSVTPWIIFSKYCGSVLCLILMLLCIAGIESNPGPYPTVHFWPVNNVKNMCFHISLCHILRYFFHPVNLDMSSLSQEIKWLNDLINGDNQILYEEAVQGLYCVWSGLNTDFEVGTQQDIHEYMIYVLQHLDWLNESQKFIFSEQSCVKCLHCPYSNEIENVVSSVILHVKDSLQASISTYFDDNQVIQDSLCTSCGQTGMTLKNNLHNEPDIITLVMNRFNGLHKDTTLIQSKDTILLQNHVYNIVAAFLHHGDSMVTGHYTALLNTGGKWIHLNDNITEVFYQPPMHLFNNLYVAFAKKKQNYSHSIQTKPLITNEHHNDTDLEQSNLKISNDDSYTVMVKNAYADGACTSDSSTSKKHYLTQETRAKLRAFLLQNPSASNRTVQDIFNVTARQVLYYKKHITTKPMQSHSTKDLMTKIIENPALDFETARAVWPNLPKKTYMNAKAAVSKKNKKKESSTNKTATVTSALNTETELPPSVIEISHCNQHSHLSQQRTHTNSINNGSHRLSNTNSVMKYYDIVRDFRKIPCIVCHMLCSSSHVIKPDDALTRILYQSHMSDSLDMQMCLKCYKCLRGKKQMPLNAWINLDNGQIPLSLQRLNQIEKRLISLMQPFLSIMTLPLGQNALKGQAIHFPTTTLEITKQLPNCATHFVCVQQENTPENTLHYANKNKVYDALAFLKKHNHLYAGTTICDKNLSILSNSADQWCDDNIDMNFTVMPQDFTNITSVGQFIGQLPELTMKRSAETPINMFSCENMEEQCFPWLFPYARGTYKQQKSMHLKQYCSSRIFNKSLIFAKDPSYIFWLFNLYQLYQLQNAVNIALRKKDMSNHYSNHLTLQNLKTNSDLPCFAWTMLKQIRGTAGYWNSTRTDLFAMFSTIGPPTFFLTFSANDINWIELHEEILVINGINRDPKDLTKTERIQMLNANSAIAVNFFMRKWLAFFRHIILGDTKPLGNVIDYFWRLEIQVYFTMNELIYLQYTGFVQVLEIPVIPLNHFSNLASPAILMQVLESPKNLNLPTYFL